MQNKLLPRWAKAISQNATEFGLTPLSVVAGEIPKGLRGIRERLRSYTICQ